MMGVNKYTDFNTVVRTKYNSLSLLYNGSEINKYYHEDYESDVGAHSRLLVFINEPDATEVGFNAAEQLTGYIQIGIFLPTSDKGLNYSLNDLSTQLNQQFPRSNFVDGDLKVEWLNVQKSENLRIDGHFTVTMRVNFRVFSC